MCMWFGFNPAVNFCHFSTLLTLSVFAGATSTSPKFDLFFIVDKIGLMFGIGGKQLLFKIFLKQIYKRKFYCCMSGDRKI